MLFSGQDASPSDLFLVGPEFCNLLSLITVWNFSVAPLGGNVLNVLCDMC
jgi:hypothetical protein